MRTIMILALFALLAGSAFAYLPSDGDGDSDDPKDEMLVDLNLSCGGNVLTIVDEKTMLPLAGVHVVVKDVTDASWVAVGDTDEKGQFTFTSCGKKVDIKLTLAGYASVLKTMDLIDCRECEGCTSDTQCPSDQACSEGSCGPVQCECGFVEKHECVPYDCCSDSDCGEDELCSDHSCSDRPDDSECYSDGDCAETQYCEMPVGAAPTGAVAGQCRDVGGCGNVVNHTLVPYRCGNAPDCPICPEGYVCVQNDCLQGNVTCPTTAFAGAQGDCSALQNEEPCVDCDYEVTDPSGGKTSGRTGGNGTFRIPFGSPGTYNVTLFGGNGTPLKTVQVTVFPASGEDGGKDTGFFGFDPLLLGGLLVALVVVGLVILYLRKRPSEKPPEKPPE